MIVNAPSDLPIVACPYCGGKHRAEAAPIDTGDRYIKYVPGSIVCPAYEADVLAAAEAGRALPAWPS